jgi:hypothetical protein
VVALALLVLAAVRSLGAQQAPAPLSRDSLAARLSAIREGADSAAIPPADRFTLGDSTVAAGRHVAGPVAVANGTLHVRGIIDGNAVAYAGDIVVHQGGEVRGDAFAILGKVLLDGGVVDGETRALSGNLSRANTGHGGIARSPSQMTMHALALAAGWFAVLLIIGIGVLLFASTNLDAVSDALERGFVRALAAGIATQLALAPALALLCVALCLTILGALLVPFAVVAYVLAAAGLITLGYLAIARMLGRALTGAETGEGTRRGVALRSLLYGLIIMMVPWFIAGAFAWSPALEVLARMVAVAITWVAATAGLGAAVVSRGGVRRATAPAAQRAMNTASWATPTPVSGVTAARRPTPLSTSVQK